MTFLKNLYKVIRVFLLVAGFLILKTESLCIYASEVGSPYIQIFQFDDNNLTSRSYSITQNGTGVILVGNFNGITEYDGSTWRQQHFPGSPFLDTTREGIVFVGGYNEFGYLSPNNLNQNEFVSLMDKVPENLLPFGQISSLKAIGNKIYFATDNNIVLWDGKNFEALHNITNLPSKLYAVDSTMFLCIPELGIQVYRNDKKTEYLKGDFFKTKMVEDILPFNDGYLVITANEHKLYIVDCSSVRVFSTPLSELFQKYGYTSGIRLSDNNYVFGTQNHGLFVMNSSGQLINHINHSHGLLEDNVSVLYIDHSDNLWVLHYNGLSRIEIPSPASYFDKAYGLKGNVSSILRHKGIIYFTTSQGVFYLAKKEGNMIPEKIQVEGIENYSIGFFTLNDKLFVTTDKGIYQIIKHKGECIFEGDIETAIASEAFPGKVFIGLKNSLASINNINGKWTTPVRIPAIKSGIISIAEENHEIIWAVTDFNGVFRIRGSKNLNTAEVEQFDSGRGLPHNISWITLLKASSEILFSTSHGLYRFNNNLQIFYPDTLLGIDFSKGNTWLHPIVEDKSKNLWFISHNRLNHTNQVEVAFYNDSSQKYNNQILPLYKEKSFHIKTIYPDEKGYVWFGGPHGVLRFNTMETPKKNLPLYANISRVILDYDSVIYNGSNYFIYKNNPLRFTFPRNTIRFDFSTTDFASENKALFQYKLEGAEENWSEWNNIQFKEYTNLSAKEYIFRLRVKNLQGQISDTASFVFRFVPPFYQTWWAFCFYFLITFSLLNMLYRQRAMRFAKERYRLEKIINLRTEELLIQKEKSDDLLANMLPKDTADELKLTGKATTHKFNMVTVLFSDIEGFTKIAERMNPEVLVDDLDKFFLKFDCVVEKYNIEKIKTIGDAYMCAGGIPDKNRTNPIEVIMAALEMTNFMKYFQPYEEKNWDLRVGIHTGSVIAGVVGQKKLSYDIWGDTVNTASRMESSGEPGKINISGSTYEYVNDFFACEYRGKMPVKYKGNIDMYFVQGIRPELSIESKGLLPNELFYIKLQLLRLQDVEEYVFNWLEKNLSENLYFHNLKNAHTISLSAELIGRAEALTDEKMLILRTAALFLNTGYIKIYKNNANDRCELVTEVLPKYKYSESQIIEVCKLLKVSFEKLAPKNPLEEILFDSYYSFLGREGLLEAAGNLFNEQKVIGIAENKKEWFDKFILFVESHNFFTQTANNLRDISKEQQIENLKSGL